MTAKRSSSLSASSFGSAAAYVPPASEFKEFMRLFPPDSACCARISVGGLSATARGPGLNVSPWNNENDDTATSPVSGDRGCAASLAICETDAH